MCHRVVRAFVSGWLLLGAIHAVRSQEVPGPKSIHPLEGLAHLQLPPEFLQRIRDRATIDSYQRKHHRVAPGILRTPRAVFARPSRIERGFSVFEAPLSEEALAYRVANDEKVQPLRGFRAPILELATSDWRAVLAKDRLGPAEKEVEAMVAGRLASDGLLLTLAHAVAVLGARACLSNVPAAEARLRTLGFPVDLLRHFSVLDQDVRDQTSADVVKTLARWLAAGVPLESIPARLAGIQFDFARSEPAFVAATESGEVEIGLLRLQVGGGWQDGIIPGGNLDVIQQLVHSFPAADVLVSVHRDKADLFLDLARRTWRIRRENQVSVCVERFPVAPWAQDNGKAGLLLSELGTPLRPATLTPRYASTDEGKSSFEPGESYLMDGLRAAGHVVVQSPLLFQGGNLLLVREPAGGQRILLVGEGDFHRNIALGLKQAEVEEAFRREFRADRVVMIPAASYHLDFDVCVRAHDGGLTAFVNDNTAAVRIIAGLGIGALERHGSLDPDAARAARADLAAGRHLAVVQRLRKIVRPTSGGSDLLQASLARCFAAEPACDSAGNLQTFLLALDFLESGVATNALSAGDLDRAEYLAALRRTEAARQAQVDRLRQLGCRVVPMPSMTDLYRGINYLNGLQHREGYVMPVIGGFFAPLDRLAQETLRRTLGADFKILPIPSAECQRHHGGVHCTAAVYPRLAPRRSNLP